MKVGCQYVPSHKTFTYRERHSDINPFEIRKRWQIGLGAATKTLKAKTQRMLRLTIMSVLRRYRSDRMFERPHIKGEIFIDTMAGRYKSLNNNRFAQLFVNNYFFDAAYPMEKKILSEQGLRELISDFEVLDRLVCVGSKEYTAKGTDFKKKV